MRSRLFCVTAITFVVTVFYPGPAGAIDDFAKHPVFAKLLGDWKSTGMLETASDGTQTPVSEAWTGSVDTGEFVMKGTRLLGETEQEFSWTFSWNPTLELIECRYYAKDMENEFDFPLEVSVSESENTVTITGQFNGQGGPPMIVVNTINDDGTMTGEVTLENDSGDPILSGTVTHKKASE